MLFTLLSGVIMPSKWGTHRVAVHLPNFLEGGSVARQHLISHLTPISELVKLQLTATLYKIRGRGWMDGKSLG